MPKFSKLIFSIYIALLCVATTTSCTPAPIETSLQQAAIHKSPNDKRNYYNLILDNGLSVMLISDPETDKAAAALDVNTGSGNDPATNQGLAHFLEHMLFLGTEKYPATDEYQRYISEHGGSHNAYTSYEHTNYFFDLDKDFLAPALDRFAQFFIAPLFNQKYVDREKHAVDSEYQSKLKDDGRRQYEVLKTITNPLHPFSKFSVGNLETLADRSNQSLRDALIKFYNLHYSTNRMKLVVLGKESIAELKALVTLKFGGLSNKLTTKPNTKEPLFMAEALPLNINIEPVNDNRSLVLTFPLSKIKQYYKTKPTAYIGNLLGHEGKGSLLSYLKKHGLAEQLSAGIGMNSDDAAIFQISLTLTKKGLQETTLIKQAIFSTLELIKTSGVKKWRFEEQQQLAHINFKFQQKTPAMHLVTQLANLMHDYPAHEVLYAPYNLEYFDKELIITILNQLTPENMVSMLTAQGLKTERTTRWFNAPYSINKPTDIELQNLKKLITTNKIYLPEPNHFIPKNLNIKVEQNKTLNIIPKQVDIAEGLTLWHQLDTSFNIPKADFWFTVRSPVAHGTPKQAVLTTLYTMAINDQLNEFSYPAALAGLHYQLYSHVRGISVRISGYNEKQSVLLSKILNVFNAPTITQERFDIFKDELTRNYENSRNDRPYSQTIARATNLLVQDRWDEPTLKNELLQINITDLQNFIPEFLKQIEIVSMANGNLTLDDAEALTTQLQKVLLKNSQPIKIKHSKVAILNQDDWLYSFKVQQPDSASLYYIQGSNTSIKQKALFSLFNQVLSSSYFNQLRTEKQLGYIVFSSTMPLLEVPAIGFVIQSPNTDAISIIEHTKEFLTSYAATIETMGQVEFTKHKSALITKIMEQDTSLSQRSRRYWHEIDKQNFEFNSRDKLALSIREYPLQQFKIDYQNLLLNKKSNALSIIAVGNKLPITSKQLSHFNLLTDKKALHKAKQYF